jgi:hypothetical protein
MSRLGQPVTDVQGALLERMLGAMLDSVACRGPEPIRQLVLNDPQWDEGARLTLKDFMERDVAVELFPAHQRHSKPQTIIPPDGKIVAPDERLATSKLGPEALHESTQWLQMILQPDAKIRERGYITALEQRQQLIQSLVDMVKRPPAARSGPWLQTPELAIELLGTLRADVAADFLAKRIEFRVHRDIDSDELVVFPAVQALVEIGNPAAFHAIHAQLDQKQPMHRLALYAAVLDRIDGERFSVVVLDNEWRSWTVPGARRRNLKTLRELCRNHNYLQLVGFKSVPLGTER